MRPGEVMISSPDGDVRVQVATVIWTAGVKPSHLDQQLTGAIGRDVECGGRVLVNPDFSIPSHPKIRITLSIKWLYALATRRRASILLSGMPSQNLALDADNAHFPMASGKGRSIAEPDAALKAAMD